MFIGSETIDLQLCLIDSAQCFTWKPLEDGYAGMIGGSAVYLRGDATGVWAEGDADVDAVRRYLDLNRDYAFVAAQYAHIPQAKRAIDLYPGLRVLNQDVWDALLSFILSANNNVRRIRNLSELLRSYCGPCKTVYGDHVYGYPAPDVLADVPEAELRNLGMGYRAPYLIKTARLVRDGFDLAALQCMDYESAHARLTQLSGVGDKVADCVLLFGCGHACAFPVDTWVEKLLIAWFGFAEKNRAKLCCEARRLLGENAGILQQFMFHAARMGDIQL